MEAAQVNSSRRRTCARSRQMIPSIALANRNRDYNIVRFFAVYHSIFSVFIFSKAFPHSNWPWEQRNKLQKPYAAYRAPPPLQLHGGRIYGVVQSVGTRPPASPQCLHCCCSCNARFAYGVGDLGPITIRLTGLAMVGVRRTAST
jgi:hypothetical protein